MTSQVVLENTARLSVDSRFDPAKDGIPPAVNIKSRNRRKASAKTLKLIKTLHIVSTSIWFGGTVVAWALMASSLNDPERFLEAVRWIPWIFSRVLMVAALIIILIGIFYGTLTQWGFFRQRWIFLKWVLLIIMIPCTAFTIGSVGIILIPAQESGVLTSVWPEAALPFALLSLQVILLTTMAVLSIFKPRLRSNQMKGHSSENHGA